MARTPLAQLIRPETLDDMFGQQHLLKKGCVFRDMIDRGVVPNMIFFGPSGVGKTTAAGIIAKNTEMQMFRLNGTSASTGDVKDVIASVDTLVGRGGVLLYLDEIQYFNKKQQQSLLETVEDGSVTLIASTTENPYFYVYSALLSRCTVFEFKPLDWRDVRAAVDRGVALLGKSEGVGYALDDETRDYLAQTAGGDVRKALNALDLLSAAAGEKNGEKTVTLDMAKQVAARSASRYDRADDVHYDLLSALQKSVRGSDPDAALFYLVRLLEAGDIISPCRRLLVMASEDIGLAYPLAVAIVKSCVDAARELGLPEAGIPLAEAAVFLATCPKSNTANEGLGAATADVQNGRGVNVPAYLRGTGYGGAEKLGRGQGYKYPHSYPNRWVEQQYLPDDLVGAKYYQFGENKTEQAAKAYWDLIKGKKK
ncbi:MAG: replication-associated recombination protein A [Oscillospiraceae bacterium]|nr:replication-associated recombination protein A [Oscillospiraceae bacterium]